MIGLVLGLLELGWFCFGDLATLTILAKASESRRKKLAVAVIEEQ